MRLVTISDRGRYGWIYRETFNRFKFLMTSLWSDGRHWQIDLIPTFMVYAHTDLHIQNPDDSASSWKKGRLQQITITVAWLFWSLTFEFAYAIPKRS